MCRHGSSRDPDLFRGNAIGTTDQANHRRSLLFRTNPTATPRANETVATRAQVASDTAMKAERGVEWRAGERVG
jgi:hypothetical protein